MIADWKDSLKALAADMPADCAPEAPAEAAEAPVASGRKEIRIEVDRKRKGKLATIIYGFDTPEEAREVASDLKRRLATGGSARDCEALIQGDCADRAAALLRERGYRPKRIGG